MNMISKCAKCCVDIPGRYRLKFIPASENGLWEMANFVYNFKLYRKPMQTPNVGGRFDQLSRWIFHAVSHKIPLYVFSPLWVRQGGSGQRGVFFFVHCAPITHRKFWKKMKNRNAWFEPATAPSQNERLRVVTCQVSLNPPPQELWP